MTAMPAQRFGLARRGTSRENYAADLVLFDPETILDTATFADPIRPPKGLLPCGSTARSRTLLKEPLETARAVFFLARDKWLPWIQ